MQVRFSAELPDLQTENTGFCGCLPLQLRAGSGRGHAGWTDAGEKQASGGKLKNRAGYFSGSELFTASGG